MPVRSRLICILVLLPLLAMIGGAHAAPGTLVSGGSERATAQVVAVDQTTRQVALMGPEGGVVVLTAGPTVRNLAQVAVGDIVEIESYRMLVTDLHKGAQQAPKMIETMRTEQAPLGAKPAGGYTRTVEFAAVVEGLDRARRLVTLRGPDGLLRAQLGADIDLERVAVGDVVEGSYVEQLTIKVTSPN